MSRTLSLLAIIAALCFCVYRLAPVEADAATDATAKTPRDRGADIEAQLGQVSGAPKPEAARSRDQARASQTTPLDKLKAATTAGTVPRPEPVERPSARESVTASPVFIPTSGGAPQSDGAVLPRLVGPADRTSQIAATDETVTGDTVASSTAVPRPRSEAVSRAASAAASSDGRIPHRRQAFRPEQFWSEGRQGGL